MEIFYEIFEVILKLSIYGTITAILILLFKVTFKNKLSSKFHYFIWFILILRISIPFLPEATASSYQKEEIKDNYSSSQNKGFGIVLSENIFLNNKYDNVDNSSEFDNEIKTNQQKSKIESTATGNGLQVENVLFTLKLLYFPVVVLIILYYLFGYTLLKVKSNKYKKCADETVIEILNSCKRMLKINKNIKLLINNENKSPMIFGMVDINMVIPKNIIKDVNYENLKYIMLHELFHYKNQDLMINWITNFLNAVYWFNPIILFSLRQMKNDCESKTDEYVISKLNKQEQINYGKAILYMIANLSKNTDIIGSNTILGGKNQMKKRINNIVNFKKPTIIITSVATLLSITIGGFCFTNSVASSVTLENSKNTSSKSINTTSTSLNSDESDASTANVKNNEIENYSSKELINYLSNLQSKLPVATALDKESMLMKMYNTGAYIASASGEYEQTGVDGSITDVKYNFKISDNNKVLFYETTKSNNENGSRVVLLTADDCLFRIDNISKSYQKHNSSTVPLAYLLPKDPLINTNNVYTVDSDGVGQLKGVFAPIASTNTTARQVLAPSEIYGGFLMMGSTWDITGSENYLGFNCVIIEGDLKDDDYSKKLQTKNFKLWVDSATGVLLKYEWYNENGKLSGALNTKKLEINKFIPDNMFTADSLDLTGYTNNVDNINTITQGESSDFKIKIKNLINDKISDDKYKNTVKNVRVTLEGDDKDQLLIKMTKIKKIPDDQLNDLMEELKDLILLSIENDSTKPSEMFFITYNENMTKDIKQYIIFKDGLEPGWNN